MKKLIYLIGKASWFTRIVAILALVAAIVSISTVWAGASTAMDTPIVELPALTTFVSEADMKEVKADLGTSSLNDVKEAVHATVEDQDLVKIMDTIFKVISVYSTVIIVALILATVFMKKGLMIFAFVISLPYCFLFVGTDAITTMAIATLVYFILMTIVNRKYKAYKRAK